MILSVIIPTRNRAAFLKDAIESICAQSLTANLFEVMVIDNASTDNTRLIVEELQSRHPYIRYIYEENPGLHNGRHRGAHEAKGEVLVYVDDDIIATPGWLRAIHESISDSTVALVGGKILPKWEGEVPEWMDLFKSWNEYGWTIDQLSLLDFGDTRREIPACYVYGCNFTIKRAVLFECGGFHPDGMPQELIRYRGDGETALSQTIDKKSLKTIYEPKAIVCHRVPPDRLTVEYFCKRAFNQGVSDSYTEIRTHGGVCRIAEKRSAGEIIRNFSRIFREKSVQKKVRAAHLAGKEFHRRSVEADPELLSYILKETYHNL